MKKIIAISGKKRAGKDSASQIFGYNSIAFKKSTGMYFFAFADVLKDIINLMFDSNIDLYDEEQKLSYVKDLLAVRHDGKIVDVGRQSKIHTYIDNKSFKITNLTYVELMQYMGQKIKSDWGEDYFTNKVINDIREITDEDALIVVSDMRFKVEEQGLQSIRDAELYTVKVTSDRSPEYSDISEHDLDDYNFNYYIENNGTLDEFEAKVLEVLDKIEA